jgi:hypothetical protein
MQLKDFRNRAWRTLKKVFRTILILVVVVGIALFSFYYWGVYDEGVRAGTVLRISKKGMLFKTYEGQLNLETFGALRGASPIMEAFDFSVEPGEKELVEELQQVALTGERVNLHYKKRYLTFPWRGDTKYFITRVERLGQAQEAK